MMIQEQFVRLLSLFATVTETPENLTKEDNQRYYLEQEDYDWVMVTDKLIGLESFFHRYREKMILSTISKYKKDGRFLDAGCGTGLVLRHLPSCSVGIDINPRHIRKAQIYVSQSEVLLADIEQIPFDQGTFSTVVCTDVLEHLLNPAKALVELYRVLQPGGVLIGTVPGRSPLWRLRFLSSTRPQEPYHRYFRRQEINDLLMQHNYKVNHLSHRILAMEILFVAEKR